MKKILFLTYLLFAKVIFAQTFSGYVLDKKTKKPIENVTVYFTGTTLGDATDENGYYKINNKF
ncbi:carboxypeptidase-like regulatory domain-containing protein [Aureivirga sp. CE67]|uniref:carboxypeptidase-like regulatory domain-containing protein n=1 Tax=Aureivirga sp. CE67 TaxID=1788983 RepID=UPI0018C914D2|nr:carboxypeptidase-like regulatory domain-containing protein [Aureivirga sp. CE67]